MREAPLKGCLWLVLGESSLSGVEETEAVVRGWGWGEAEGPGKGLGWVGSKALVGNCGKFAERTGQSTLPSYTKCAWPCCSTCSWENQLLKKPQADGAKMIQEGISCRRNWFEMGWKLFLQDPSQHLGLCLPLLGIQERTANFKGLRLEVAVRVWSVGSCCHLVSRGGN